MLSLIYCLFVLITEATVIYDPHYTLMYLVSLSQLISLKVGGASPGLEV